MSSKYTAFIRATILFVALFTFGSVTTFAQEGEPIVIDEVIAQANDGVITLSQLKREIAEAIEALMQTGKSEADARKEVEAKKGQLIVGLIDEILIMQRGKEMGLAEEVENEVNRRLLDIGAQQGIKTIEELYKQMRASGFDPEAIKYRFRVGVMTEMVLRNDVDAKTYWSPKEKELQEYYKKHEDKFKKPEVVSFSEIFLGFAGKSEEEVMKKAEQIIAELRKGEDFAKMAATYSERAENGVRLAPKTGGKVGTFTFEQLNPEFAKALKPVKVGGITDPIRIDVGVEILRVDERIAGTDKPVYEENRVREAILYERQDGERKKYAETLRKEAFVKVSENYQPLVANLLSTTTPNAASTASKDKDKEKEKNKKNKN